MTMLAESIDAVRMFNRFYTKHLGALEDGYLQSEFTLTEARVLFEIWRLEAPTAKVIRHELGHDGGYLSRVLRKLQDADLVTARPSVRDGREVLLSLTPLGRATMLRLDQRSRAQIGADLEKMPEATQRNLVTSMSQIRQVLDSNGSNAEPLLRTHRPGDIGWIVGKHGDVYCSELGWGEDFEGLVAEIAGGFLTTFDRSCERCWIAELDGVRVGTVMLVQHPDLPGTAKLRLLLVDPMARGRGLGRMLVEGCLDFAREAGYDRVILWTNRELTAARRIYKSVGFALTNVEEGHQFGRAFVGETWEIELAR